MRRWHVTALLGILVTGSLWWWIVILNSLGHGNGGSADPALHQAAPKSMPLGRQQVASSNQRSTTGPEKDSTQAPLRQPVPDPEMARFRQQVDDWVAGVTVTSGGYQERVRQLRALPTRQGILVTAGGHKLVASLVLLLKVLREHLHCQLPVQVAFRSPAELDNVTLVALSTRWGPLTGLDLSLRAQPHHHKLVDDMGGWVAKIYALYHCDFQQVLMLDADSLPLSDPAQLFSLPVFSEHGSLFWPDIWDNWVPHTAYDKLGLNATATKAALSAAQHWPGHTPGAGSGPGAGASSSSSSSSLVVRDTESGQVLLDRVMHAEVLEQLWWINTFAPEMYRHLHGDKDTFPLAFALAGKANHFQQVAVPPGGAFRWGSGVLEVKAAAEGSPERYLDGWQLVGCVQYHPSSIAPLFLHRTMAKWSAAEEPAPIQLITSPIPARWARYYLAHDSTGPTKGRWWEHVVPPDALTIMHAPVTPKHTRPHRTHTTTTPASTTPTPTITPTPGPTAATQGLLTPNLAATPTGSPPASSQPASLAAPLSQGTLLNPGTLVRAQVSPSVQHQPGQPHPDGLEVVPVEYSFLGCPTLHYLQYARLRALALPVDRNVGLEFVCDGFVQALPAAAACPLHDPPLTGARAARQTVVTGAESSVGCRRADGGGWQVADGLLRGDPHTFLTHQYMEEWVGVVEGPGSSSAAATPLPALHVELGTSVTGSGSHPLPSHMHVPQVLAAEREAYKSHQWLRQNQQLFPAIKAP